MIGVEVDVVFDIDPDAEDDVEVKLNRDCWSWATMMDPTELESVCLESFAAELDSRTTLPSRLRFCPP
ncbi:hypothetical protein RRF57_011356 [Xylaria bambusicola]|uniref:Uncharacterized protein n=1 Tax=Xylaria bambusicola TaxID=326684 RepID=A0AAN7V4H9_9PEZI